MPARQPNILLLMVDQQRADAIAAWQRHAGRDPVLRTPNLDRLSEEGANFTRCYTPSPVCMSARCSMLTGRLPHRTGCVNNMPMPRNVPTMATALSALGYHTASVGKMHFHPDPYGDWGFDERDTSEEIPGPADDYVQFLRGHGFGHVIEPHGLRSEYYYVPQPSQLPMELHHTHWVADRSIAILQRHQSAAASTGKPFFLVSSFIKPHPPFENPVPFDKLYRGPDMSLPFRSDDQESLWTYWNRVQNRYKYGDAGFDARLAQLRRAAYYGCISFIDQQIGRILEALGEAIDDTLILFTADHGELLDDYGCLGKRSMLDASAQVPMIARFPQRLDPGFHDTATSLCDLLPTCVDAALGEPPADAQEQSDGQSLLGIATSPDPQRVIQGQFERGRYALHFAADANEKYIYSAADNVEWVFEGTHLESPDESRRVVTRKQGTSVSHRLKSALVESYQADCYRSAVDEKGLIEYAPPSFDARFDHGLLYQDSPELESRVAHLGPDYKPVGGYRGSYVLLATPDAHVRQSDVRTPDAKLNSGVKSAPDVATERRS